MTAQHEAPAATTEPDCEVARFVLLDTPRRRATFSRIVAYDLARQFGLPIPCDHWPPRDRFEWSDFLTGLIFRLSLN